MFNFINKLKIRNKILTIISFFIMGFIILGVYSVYSLSKVKVNGEMYNSVHEVRSSIDNITKSSEQGTEGTVNVAEKVNNITQNSCDVRIQCNKLNESVQNQKEQISKVKLS